MKKIVALIELLEKNAPESLWKIACCVREDIQRDIDGLQYDEDRDPELIVEATFGELIHLPEGGYLSRDIIADLDNYYHFTGEWVTPEKYDDIIKINESEG
ncbi:MAG: hypothetical protein DRP56_04910 [Planctomycetota bacterium]|nr:MAG: hypothetical protein DRP56_04910 [Planctomycetota bacterium]